MALDVSFVKLEDRYIDDLCLIESASNPFPWNRRMFEQELQVGSSTFFVAILDGKAIGFAGLRIHGDFAELMNIAVDPRFRRFGVGGSILDFLISIANNEKLNGIFLDVRQSNVAAEKLYISRGFNNVGRRVNYYGNEDALLMEKKIERA